jgi:hypothetical protein
MPKRETGTREIFSLPKRRRMFVARILKTNKKKKEKENVPKTKGINPFKNCPHSSEIAALKMRKVN